MISIFNGKTTNIKIKNKMEQVHNKSICEAYNTERGTLASHSCKKID